MDRELVIIQELIESLEKSADKLERSACHAKGFSEAYIKGRVQGMRDCACSIKELFYMQKKEEK